MAKKFTFADAKLKIKELEDKLILDTKDNVYTSKENDQIKFFKYWSVIGPLVGFLLAMFIYK